MSMFLQKYRSRLANPEQISRNYTQTRTNALLLSLMRFSKENMSPMESETQLTGRGKSGRGRNKRKEKR